jgi:4-hydroxy-3-methylbut-2-enyl diphosphate reductase
MDILLANPRGFCAGVDRAITIVEQALARFGPPIYVRHEVVHNRYVVSHLRAEGALFVDSLAEVPDGSIVIFSAHGVPMAVRQEAERRGLQIFDATCPLVTKVHMEVMRHQRDGRECILIGHAGHPEVEGTLGQYAGGGSGGGMYLVETPADAAKLSVKDPNRLAFVTQTTLSMDDTAGIIRVLRERFPAIIGPRRDDICYATQNRQDAVKALAPQCDIMIVVGSPNSSNSNRLRELSVRLGTPAYLVDGADDLCSEWFTHARKVGVTAGASAPEKLVHEVVARLQSWAGGQVLEAPGRQEKVVFPLPRGLG